MSLDDHVKAVKAFNPDLYGMTLTAWHCLMLGNGGASYKPDVPNLTVIRGRPIPQHQSGRGPSETEVVDYCVLGRGANLP